MCVPRKASLSNRKYWLYKGKYGFTIAQKSESFMKIGKNTAFNFTFFNFYNSQTKNLMAISSLEKFEKNIHK